jgi:peptidoglycan/LPS O-acetylase OafA/YrhL
MPLGVRVPPSASIEGVPVTAAPPIVAPPPGHPRFPLLDSMRAIAVLCVVLTHTGSLSGLNESSWLGDFTARLDLGVAVFFLISGFLIYRPFVNTRVNGAPATPLVVFARRRFLRIFPAYWLALTVLAISPGLPDVHSGRWWVYYGLFQAYDPTWFDKGIGAAWSLSTEVAFYALLPIYALAVGRFVRGVRVELALLGLLATASVVARAVVTANEQHAKFGTASTFPITIGGTFLWFALGMTLAVISVWLQGRSGARPPRAIALIERRPWIPWLLAFGLFVLVSKGIGITGKELQPLSVAQNVGEHLLYAGVALCLLLPAVFGDASGGWPRRVLANRWLGMLGLISYGVFLWHLTLAIKLSGERAGGWLPVGRFLSLTVVALAVTVPVAIASYLLVERPLLRLKYRQGSAQPARSAAS